MSNENVHNNQIGLRIRAARRRKALNQTELANLLGKSLRTIQKYESGEIEISIATINAIAEILECDSSYLMGYDPHAASLSNLSDIFNFFCMLDRIKDVTFDIETKRPPHHNGWECTIKFNGKDRSAPLNADICLFLEDFQERREEVQIYMRQQADFQEWQDETLAYYALKKLEEKEIEELSREERLKRFQAIMNERYGNEQS